MLSLPHRPPEDVHRVRRDACSLSHLRCGLTRLTRENSSCLRLAAVRLHLSTSRGANHELGSQVTQTDDTRAVNRRRSEGVEIVTDEDHHLRAM